MLKLDSPLNFLATNQSIVQPQIATRNRKISVCELLHSLDVGGAEMLAKRIAERLRDRFRFVFVCLDSLGGLGAQLQSDGFEVHVLNRKSGLDWRCPRQLARLIRELNIDVIHAHQYTPFFYAAASRLLSHRTPINFTEHGRHQPDYPRRKRIIANRFLLRRQDRIVAVGAAVRQALIDNEGLPPDRIEIVYNGISTENYAPSFNREQCRAILGASIDEFVLIQVARLDYLKDHITAVRTLARIVARRPRSRLVLVGDGPERTHIEAEANRLGVRSQLTFLGSRNDVASLLNGADAFLLSSTSEGIPLTVLEAMAAGLPVIATNVGGMSEVVVPNQTGLLTPARDHASLADAALLLADNPKLATELGRAGRERVRTKFEESKMCSVYASLFESMVAA